MQITITARHFELTNAIRDHVMSSCEKLTRYFDYIINIHFVLSLENNRNIAEMTLHASHFNLQADAEEKNMYLTIDEAVDKMETQIKKLKDKVTNHQKKQSLKENIAYVYSNIFENNLDDKPKKIVKMKRMVADPMLVDDAINELVKSKKEYFIFKNLESDRINVLVKKNKEQFKLIEP
jgi:putative sigma-54 modulation protein